MALIAAQPLCLLPLSALRTTVGWMQESQSSCYRLVPPLTWTGLHCMRLLLLYLLHS